MRARRVRYAHVALALPLAAAALAACTAGSEIAYRSSALTADGGSGDGEGGDTDGGRLVLDSAADVPPRPGDHEPAEAAAPFACTGLVGSCDPTAGMGCCLRNVAGNVGADNQCFPQADHFGGPSCGARGDVFLACLTSDTDSTCCWQAEADGTVNTRYRPACAGGAEACNPSGDAGVCTTGGPCTAVTCKGVTVGYCGGGAPPCQP